MGRCEGRKVDSRRSGDVECGGGAGEEGEGEGEGCGELHYLEGVMFPHLLLCADGRREEIVVRELVEEGQCCAIIKVVN